MKEDVNIWTHTSIHTILFQLHTRVQLCLHACIRTLPNMCMCIHILHPGGHVDAQYYSGQLAIQEGTVNACSASFHIDIQVRTWTHEMYDFIRMIEWIQRCMQALVHTCVHSCVSIYINMHVLIYIHTRTCTTRRARAGTGLGRMRLWTPSWWARHWYVCICIDPLLNLCM